MNENNIQRARQWLSPLYDEQTRADVEKLLAGDPKELEDCFYKNLEFGTGGLRGIIGTGTNRMNRYTVGMATQGLANYVKMAQEGPYRAAISFDCRNYSAQFAQITAQVLAANGFKVYLFDALRPTPELSFAVRELHCNVGVMITASHNPKEYNGYKAYWNDGAQVTAPHDENIIKQVLLVDSPAKVKFSGEEGSIEIIGQQMDEQYLTSILSLLNLSPDAIAAHKDLKMVYTPLHGTGVRLVPEALRRMGFTQLTHVPEQDVNDGNFPTVKSPNPEEPDALALAVAKAKEVGADLVMATDPDADRVGIAVRNLKGEMQLLNGNQTASLLTYYLLRKWKDTGRIQGKEFIVKTIVTTDLLRVMASHFGVTCYNVLTGFKYIAQIVREQEGKTVFIGGGEESFGYNVGSFVRDKDAVVACALVAEVACWAAQQGKSLYQLLIDIYVEFGFYQESLLSKTMKGKDGMEQIQAMMNRYRQEPPKEFAGVKVVQVLDYLHDASLPKSNVIQFLCEDRSLITVRPSGTEPKIKFYFGLHQPLSCAQDFDKVNVLLQQRVTALKAQI